MEERIRVSQTISTDSWQIQWIQEKLTNKKLSKDLSLVADIWRKELETTIDQNIEKLKLNLLKQKDFSNISLKLAEQLQSIQAEVDNEEDNHDDNNDDIDNQDEDQEQDQKEDNQNLNEEDSDSEENLSAEPEDTDTDIIEDENSDIKKANMKNMS